MQDNKGFTLVELMIVIAILAILAAVVVFALNPAQLMARARDSQRISDLQALTTAINYFTVISPTPYLDNATNSTCKGIATTATIYATVTSTTAPGGAFVYNTTGVTSRAMDGSGWLKVNFAATGETPLAQLPWDPSNGGVAGSPSTYYAFVCSSTGAYEINTSLESNSYKPQEGTDGGDIATVYEVGTSLTIAPSATSGGWFPNN